MKGRNSEKDWRNGFVMSPTCHFHMIFTQNFVFVRKTSVWRVHAWLQKVDLWRMGCYSKRLTYEGWDVIGCFCIDLTFTGFSQDTYISCDFFLFFWQMPEHFLFLFTSFLLFNWFLVVILLFRTYLTVSPIVWFAFVSVRSLNSYIISSYCTTCILCGQLSVWCVSAVAPSLFFCGDLTVWSWLK